MTSEQTRIKAAGRSIGIEWKMRAVARVLLSLVVAAGASFSALEHEADVRVKVPLSLGRSTPIVVELVNPGRRTERDRIPELRAALAQDPAILAGLPLICSGGSSGGSGGSSQAEVECWADALAVQLESTLVRHELATMTGRYWNLAGFYRGVAYGNEVNRMVQQVVQKVSALAGPEYATPLPLRGS